MAVQFKQSISDPIAVDIGNQTTQGRIVSKTIQFGLFTTNENAVWAANQQIQKESYPFAYISIQVNRDMFRLQVGDVFKFSYAKYGISNMICRILQVEEEDLKSEKITIHCMEDIFSVANSITEYTDPENNAQAAPDYTVPAFSIQQVREAPYALSTTTAIVPLASIDDDLILGYDVYMSIDLGASYSFLGRSTGIQPYGTLAEDYPLTYTIDETEGLLVDFVNGQNLIETVSWADVLSGKDNLALLGDEYISFQSVTPITDTQYQLEGIIRNRFGSQRTTHASGTAFTVVSKSLVVLSSTEIAPGADRKFKFVPYNSKLLGSIADATEMDLSIVGLSETPYIPEDNLFANGDYYNPVYSSDVVLTWTARLRGGGAGVGVPGTVLAESEHEGLFKVEVYVSDVLVRTTEEIDALTWTYTSTMNLADNTTLASSITFKLSNYIVLSGITYESDQATVICNLS